ncbi:MAG: nitrite/sulfite reductase [Candidatus Binatus sp.]|uniref:nitrite/sulfite reductase n=1 Tax=Candidatus Binatus sp. TaxID=2811406 RepID=UPI002727FADF|nr:nitrite/sulfite reductase [Candidatus Binatus sp.]MDO8432248.1 nitrite/sulfite reductase [Candidatus Binatus sp.]
MPRKEPQSWEMVLKRNSVERLKHELFPTELAGQWNRLAETSYEKLPEEDIVRLQWFGMYHDKPKIGTFMMRVKIPSGILSADGLRAIGEISETYGRDQGELTTRQNFQLHYITLDKFPEILERLKRVGLTTMGGCGDVVRNITGCPVAGVDHDELFDVTPLIAEAAGFFYGNREYSDLPRKHKITIAACRYHCNAPEINCVALIGMVRDGREGFAVRVGGGQSSTPRLARHLGVFITREQAMPVMRAIIDVWKGTTEYRISRVKARLKFMIDDYGPAEFRKLVEARLGYALEDLAETPLPDDESDHMGISAQKQDGRHYAGFPVYLGLMSGRQMRAIADLVGSFGGDIRLTRRQNFIITGIPTAQLDDVIAKVGEIGFPLSANGLYASSIGCIGDPHCNYAVTPTKTKLATIIERLVAEFGEQVGGLKLNLDGCPHACAQHWTGDIGLQGTTGRGPNGEPLEAFDIILRGGLGRDAAIGKPVLRRVPSAMVEDQVTRLFGAYLERRQAGESFTRFCVRTSDAELTSIANGNAIGADAAA